MGLPQAALRGLALSSDWISAAAVGVLSIGNACAGGCTGHNRAYTNARRNPFTTLFCSPLRLAYSAVGTRHESNSCRHSMTDSSQTPSSQIKGRRSILALRDCIKAVLTAGVGTKGVGGGGTGW